MRAAFTLIELLVVIAIIAVLAALIFPVFISSKRAAKKVNCLSNTRQIGIAVTEYTGDYDGRYPQTKPRSEHPEVDDVGGAIEEPELGSVFTLLLPYMGSSNPSPTGTLNQALVYKCPEDNDPFGKVCETISPDAPDVTSYIVNGFFVFGLDENRVTNPSETIYAAERRSQSAGNAPPYCDAIYRPWWNATNPQAPEDEMDATEGGVATKRHLDQSNFVFADSHVKTLPWAKTYAPPAVNLHQIGE